MSSLFCSPGDEDADKRVRCPVTGRIAAVLTDTIDPGFLQTGIRQLGRDIIPLVERDDITA